VSAKSNPSSVAGSIVKNYNEGKEVSLIGIGAGSINQGVKAVAIARGFIASQGVDLAMIPAFTDTVVDGEDRTAMVYHIISLQRG
jgi:stage V sporulation protein S